MTNEQKAVKRVLEKVWDNATTNDEVGARWILLQIAKDEGVKLDRELKKYGANKDACKTVVSKLGIRSGPRVGI